MSDDLYLSQKQVIYDLIRYFDMFAGIGGFRAGFDRAGGYQCVGHCEIDKYADAGYRAIHDIRKEECFYPNARDIDPAALPDFDLLCGGFPCQSFSLAGKREGFKDPRGTLFFEISSFHITYHMAHGTNHFITATIIDGNCQIQSSICS